MLQNPNKWSATTNPVSREASTYLDVASIWAPGRGLDMLPSSKLVAVVTSVTACVLTCLKCVQPNASSTQFVARWLAAELCQKVSLTPHLPSSILSDQYYDILSSLCLQPTLDLLSKTSPCMLLTPSDTLLRVPLPSFTFLSLLGCLLPIPIFLLSGLLHPLPPQPTNHPCFTTGSIMIVSKPSSLLTLSASSPGTCCSREVSTTGSVISCSGYSDSIQPPTPTFLMFFALLVSIDQAMQWGECNGNLYFLPFQVYLWLFVTVQYISGHMLPTLFLSLSHHSFLSITRINLCNI